MKFSFSALIFILELNTFSLKIEILLISNIKIMRKVYLAYAGIVIYN